jgi:DNA-binding transcriptional ArsR family regulator
MPDHQEADGLAETFRVLSDPGRIRVILVLLEVGEAHVGGLAEAAGLSETACSHALRLLRHAHVVKRRKVGRSALYSLDDDHISGLVELARDHVEHAPARR